MRPPDRVTWSMSQSRSLPDIELLFIDYWNFQFGRRQRYLRNNEIHLRAAFDNLSVIGIAQTALEDLKT